MRALQQTGKGDWLGDYNREERLRNGRASSIFLMCLRMLGAQGKPAFLNSSFLQCDQTIFSIHRVVRKINAIPKQRSPL